MAAIDEFLNDPNIALLRIMSILASANYAEKGPFDLQADYARLSFLAVEAIDFPLTLDPCPLTLDPLVVQGFGGADPD